MIKHTLFFVIAFFSFTTQAWNSDSKIDTHSFMQRIKGRYDVLAVNAVKPHSNNPAQIAIDDPAIADWVMPYCLKDSCLPGFVSFDFALTEVHEEVISPTNVRYLISQKENGVVTNYYWREVEGRLFFRNPQYQLPGHTFADLEHELRKQP